MVPNYIINLMHHCEFLIFEVLRKCNYVIFASFSFQLISSLNGCDFATIVTVSSEKPTKVFRSREYSVLTGTFHADSVTNEVYSDVTVDYPEQTYVEVTLEGDTSGCDIYDAIVTEIKRYLDLYQ